MEKTIVFKEARFYWEALKFGLLVAIITLLMLLATFLMPLPVRAADIPVSAGTDLNALLRLAKPGDVFILADGYYDGGVWVSERNGTALSPITLKALNAGKVIVLGSSATRKDGFTLYKSDWWILDGVTFEKAANAGLRISSSDHITGRGIFSRQNAVFGMLAGNSSFGTFTSSSFLWNAEQHGAYVSTPNATGWTFVQCTFAFNGMCGVQFNSQGASTTASPITDCRVLNCSITNNGQSGAGAAVNCLGVVNSIFAGNDIHNNLAGGVSFTTNGRVGGESTGNLVSNCAITFKAGTGRSCVQTTYGTQTVVGCRLWSGRSAAAPLSALKGGVLVQSDNTVLPVATVSPAPDSGTTTGTTTGTVTGQ